MRRCWLQCFSVNDDHYLGGYDDYPGGDNQYLSGDDYLGGDDGYLAGVMANIYIHIHIYNLL